jgi:hypothetical protein
MKEPKNFLARWSRRKRGAAAESRSIASQERIPEPLVPAGTQSQTAQAEQATLDSRLRGNERAWEAVSPEAKQPELADPAFDISKLPSIESITAETDIRAFLAPGVPPELTRAALRRAWSADPAIRDYVGLSENAWDFNAPDSAPGFGALQMTDELRRQIARMLGGSSAESADRPASNSTEGTEKQPSAETSVGLAATQKPSVPAVHSEANKGSTPAAEEPRGHDALLQRKTEGDAALQHGAEESEAPQPVARRGHGRALPG